VAVLINNVLICIGIKFNLKNKIIKIINKKKYLNFLKKLNFLLRRNEKQPSPSSQNLATGE